MKWKQLLISIIIFIGLILLGSQPIFAETEIPILMYYHLVLEGSDSITLWNNSVLSVSHFEEQMHYLAQNGYKTIFMSELKNYLAEQKERQDKVVVISFDDGYESNYIYAYPILKEFGLKANIAIVVRPTQLRDSEEALTEYHPARHSHLTFDEAREMLQSGLIEFGSHTYDSHDKFKRDIWGSTSNTSAKTNRGETEEEYKKRILDDLLKSRQVMLTELGVNPTYFAYPYGKCNQTISDLVAYSGFDIAVTIKKGYVDQGSLFLQLPRLNISQNLSLTDFAHLIEKTSIGS